MEVSQVKSEFGSLLRMNQLTPMRESVEKPQAEVKEKDPPKIERTEGSLEPEKGRTIDETRKQIALRLLNLFFLEYYFYHCPDWKHSWD